MVHTKIYLVLISDLNPENLNFETIEKIKKLNIKDLPTLDANSRIGACVKNPSKFLGIGLNFKDHATEQNLPIPKEPIIFQNLLIVLLVQMII